MVAWLNYKWDAEDFCIFGTGRCSLERFTKWRGRSEGKGRRQGWAVVNRRGPPHGSFFWSPKLVDCCHDNQCVTRLGSHRSDYLVELVIGPSLVNLYNFQSLPSILRFVVAAATSLPHTHARPFSSSPPASASCGRPPPPPLPIVIYRSFTYPTLEKQTIR